MVDIFLSKNEKIGSLEKKIQVMERKMSRNFATVGATIEMMKLAMLKLQAENAELKNDREFLLGKYRDALRRMEIAGSSGGANVILGPIKNEIKDASILIREIAEEGLDANKENIDNLFEIVMNRKKITLEKAAKELNVDEKRLRYWAMKLEKQDLIKIENPEGKMMLSKIHSPKGK